MTRLYDEALRPTGLRITQLAVLVQIRRAGTASIAELADALSTERSSMAREVSTLQKQGLVSSSTNPRDRRFRDVRLTAEGGRRLDACAPRWRAAQEHVRAALGADQAQALASIAGDLVEALESPPTS